MSRHKMMHNLDLDEELYDGYDDGYDDDEPEMSADDRAQLAAALRTTRSRLPPTLPAIPDREIEDLLWDSYYDVDKTVKQLVKKYAPKPATAPAKKEVGCGQDWSFGSSRADYGGAAITATAAGLFADMPWGRVDPARVAEMVPVHHGMRGGLLGGSKLAALAKARKEKKEREAAEAAAAAAKTEGGAADAKKSAVSLLDRLGKKPAPSPSQEAPAQVKADTPPSTDTAAPVEVAAPHIEAPATPAAPAESPAVIPKSAIEPSPSPEPAVPQIPLLKEEEKEPLKAAPSPFAASVFGARLDVVGENVVADTRVFTLLGKKAAKLNKDPFAEPSPDDKVMAAQAQSKGLNKNAADAKGVEQGIKNMSIEHKEKPAIPPLTKIDVLKEYRESKEKENINFVVVGHVDAGKSTLMGRMLLDTGAIDQKVVDKFKREAEQIGKGSFHLAWVLDQTSEERNRGVTIDISVNKFETERVNFTILDAPGHKDFVPNMIAGAAQADFAVLVIDASTGAFESGFHLRGQTKEHTLLVRSMGVQKLVVAVNKLDTVGWSEDRFTEIQQQMLTFLTNAGFQPQNIVFVPCSGLTGTNIVRKPAPSEIPWYRGPTLLHHLETSHPYSRPVAKPLRLTVSDVFKSGPQNNMLTVAGRIDAGFLQEAEPLLIIPSRELCYAKSIFVDDAPRKWAVAGHNVMIQLVPHDDDLHPRAGDVICKPSAPLKPLRAFTLKMLAFELITPMNVDVHRGVLHAPGRVVRLLRTLDKATGEVLKKKPRAVTPGALAVVVVEMVGDALVPLEAGMKVVLRSAGVSVAAGIVEG